MYRFISLACIIAVVISSCRKDEHIGGGGILLGTPLQLSVDSLCVQAPNVFTPNGDGIDEKYWVQCRNALAFDMIIRNSSDSVVFHSTDQDQPWEGIDHTVNDSLPTAGAYHVSVEATGTSGAQLSGGSTVYVVLELNTPCFSSLVPPVFGDQFDPRLCGPVYPTNDAVCVQ